MHDFLRKYLIACNAFLVPNTYKTRADLDIKYTITREERVIFFIKHFSNWSILHRNALAACLDPRLRNIHYRGSYHYQIQYTFAAMRRSNMKTSCVDRSQEYCEPLQRKLKSKTSSTLSILWIVMRLPKETS